MDIRLFYSLRSESTGLLNAALSAWKLIVSKAMAKDKKPANKKAGPATLINEYPLRLKTLRKAIVKLL